MNVAEVIQPNSGGAPARCVPHAGVEPDEDVNAPSDQSGGWLAACRGAFLNGTDES